MTGTRKRNLFTPIVAEEIRKAGVSVKDVEILIGEQEGRGFRRKLPGPGNLYCASKVTDDGMIYVEYTTIDEDTFRTHTVVRFPQHRWTL